MERLLELLMPAIIAIEQNNVEKMDLQKLIEYKEICEDIARHSFDIRNMYYTKILEKYLNLLIDNNKYYDHIKIAQLEDPSIKNTLCIEHIGGYPSLLKAKKATKNKREIYEEKWPTNIYGIKLTFIAQFIYQKNILYRVFADLNDKTAAYYRCMPIPYDDTMQFIKNLNFVYPDIIPLKEYKIVSWVEHKKLKPYEELISDEAILDTAISDAAISDAAISNAAISNAAISDAAILDTAISNEAISDATSNVLSISIDGINTTISKEEYNELELMNDQNILKYDTAVLYSYPINTKIKDLDKKMIIWVNANLLGQQNNGENYYFYHQDRMVVI